jgi:1-pyrroline-5-carboxylate dehydrogenase
VLAGGSYDDSECFFVRPTVFECSDPTDESFTTEYFGPILAVHVYDDGDYDTMLKQMESAPAYGLTGSILARGQGCDRAGDRVPAVLGRQLLHQRQAHGRRGGTAAVRRRPRLGTNDKAGSAQNLMRWGSTRSIKETFVPAKDYRHPHMGS